MSYTKDNPETIWKYLRERSGEQTEGVSVCRSARVASLAHVRQEDLGRGLVLLDIRCQQAELLVNLLLGAAGPLRVIGGRLDRIQHGSLRLQQPVREDTDYDDDDGH